MRIEEEVDIPTLFCCGGREGGGGRRKEKEALRLPTFVCKKKSYDAFFLLIIIHLFFLAMNSLRISMHTQGGGEHAGREGSTLIPPPLSLFQEKHEDSPLQKQKKRCSMQYYVGWRA